ncbi:iron-containing alcohol dehydrogenase [Desulfovibrio oxyclinae]|uniref:iron-containing alcohol dehydrogenase n=1 Tax=Desulfovibrio oxyclinae TaxID=63560 RepID=UPI0003732AF3|nr:iron-containing alcohol dehydrogenase [Desulfovibrio oxyclinae]
MHFNFRTPGRILFGAGTASELPSIVSSFGKRVCVVTGSSPQRHDDLTNALMESGAQVLVQPTQGEPDTDAVAALCEKVREFGAQALVGIGGGSVIDAAKAVSALAANPGDMFEHLEVVGKGEPITRKPLPLIAIPTTSGTGAEVTANAVLLSREHGVKVSLRSPMMIPEVALVDPELAVEMPPGVTASTGMDALTQLLEALVSRKATPMTDALCRDGLARAAAALPDAWHDPEDMEAREDMAYAAMLSGIALANAGLGAVHGFAAPIGGRFEAPHGAVCAALLPHVMRANIEALRERDSGSDRLAAYAGAAWLLCRTADATVDDGVSAVAELCGELEIPGLSAYGMGKQDIEPMVEAAAAASSMRGNPVDLTRDELRKILENAL